MKNSSRKGVRIIAIIEAAKAVLILAVGFGLLGLIHRDVEAIAIRLIDHFHFDRASKYPQLFLRAAQHVTDLHLWIMVAFALTDAVIRGVLAYGLWNDRRWASWLGVIAGGIYLPFEVYELCHGVTLLKLIAFLINVAIVIYLGMDLHRARN